MEISSIRIRKIDNDSNLKAIASVNFDEKLVVHSIRLVEGKDGLFLSFPAVVRGEGKYFDIAHPVNNEFRDELTTKIIEEYNKIDK